ncbi:hypothetical protein RB620_14355 [Paenibacillus sp. LHD-117]|uniref:hypothetical protein n=1 Tax=Paenibacillus sp. LHD-117 TaxID=3071412 RepID=UPI0027E198CC|nr:hypothetical protein [Paenibacillus sp. LHD-117]MDQ6420609.1 hypothetical protein [Paenibacillus sp. LHD-117]
MSYFCDFAYSTPVETFIFEIKGFGPHVKDMDRQKYCNELNRETFLSAMGYRVISFAYDDVSQRPELCITLLRMILGRYVKESSPITMKKVTDREIVRLACILARPLRPIDVEKHLDINHRTAVKILHSLSERGLFTPISGGEGKYVVRYEMNPAALRLL